MSDITERQYWQLMGNVNTLENVLAVDAERAVERYRLDHHLDGQQYDDLFVIDRVDGNRVYFREPTPYAQYNIGA
tara:strand:- start:193 stop:417 length:225 start_codon:yes stop_codon:yes gene_type:complete